MSKSIPPVFAARIEAELNQLRQKHLARAIKTRDLVLRTNPDKQTALINFSTNDYLGLAHHPRVIEAAIEATRRYGTSASSSRAVTGALPPHGELERAIEELLELDDRHAVLLFGSGALTNLGIFSALLTRHDLVITDRLVHATIIDGVKLSGARFERFAHNNLEELEQLLRREREQRKDSTVAVVTESIFSMDGDRAPLPEIVALCERYGALSVVDEAHALGVFGRQGGGLVCEYGLRGRVSVTVGTLGKSFAAYGGFVAADRRIIELMTTAARTFLYSTALPPGVVAAATAAIAVVRAEQDLGRRLLELSAKVAEALKTTTSSQIIPIVLGDNERTLSMAQRLEELGVIATAIRPPTVPINTARLRLSLSLRQTPEEVMHGAKIINDLLRHERGN